MSNSHLDQFIDAYSESFAYHDENMLMLAWYVRRVIDTLRVSPVGRLLSLGIGHSIVTQNLMQEVSRSIKEYIIVEGLSAIIRQFQESEHIPANVQVVHSMFEDFVADEPFDAIEMGFVLEHVDNPKVLLTKVMSLLHNGGMVFISVPNARSLHRLIGHQAGLLDDVYWLSEHDLAFGHQRYFDRDMLTNLVQECGFTIATVEGILLKPFTTAQLKSLQLPHNVYEALCKVGQKLPDICNAVFVQATR